VQSLLSLQKTWNVLLAIRENGLLPLSPYFALKLAAVQDPRARSGVPEAGPGEGRPDRPAQGEAPHTQQ
jgi:hypothetical protein